MIAKSFDIWSKGPITNPNELPKVLGDALKVVKEGKPALVDVVCEMRPWEKMDALRRNERFTVLKWIIKPGE